MAWDGITILLNKPTTTVEELRRQCNTMLQSMLWNTAGIDDTFTTEYEELWTDLQQVQELETEFE